MTRPKKAIEFELHELAELVDAINWHIPRVRRVSAPRAENLSKLLKKIEGKWTEILADTKVVPGDAVREKPNK